MVSGEQNLKMLKKQYAMIEKLDDSFREFFTCEGVKCEDCPFNMGDKELPFRGKTTPCAYAAISEIVRKVVRNNYLKI